MVRCFYSGLWSAPGGETDACKGKIYEFTRKASDCKGPTTFLAAFPSLLGVVATVQKRKRP